MHRITSTLVVVAAVVLAPPAAGAGEAPAVAAATVPQTIPALRQWTPGTGTYTFGPASRIVVDPAATALDDEAATFAADLAEVVGRGVAVVRGTAAPGDIRLALGGGGPVEGYTMTAGATLTVQGATDAGTFAGTRTVLQLLRRSTSVPAGTAVDAPTKPERGLMIDLGRKYVSLDWLRRHIRELSYLKLNTLHLHLSDNFGFRLESTTHPEVVSAQHYTKQQIRDLVALAARYHVTIVPEIDMPGHLDAVLAAHPELRLGGHPSFIDLGNDASYTLMRDLITEYLPLFPGRYWHLGADEYVTNYADYPQLLAYARARYGPNATAKDTYYGFINWANDIVRAAGRTMRMWNDGIKAGDGTINPASTIVVEYWYNYGLTPQQLLGRGHTISNQSWDPTYYVLGGGKPDARWGYETWTPDLFQGGTTITDPARNLGTNVHVWCDNPAAETEDQIAAGIRTILRVVAQQTWGSPKIAPSYADFVRLAAELGRAPGWPTTSQPGNLVRFAPVTVSSTETADFPGAAAVDGDATTRWSSAYADPSWISVDLGATRGLNRVVLRWEGAYARAYQIQVSPDGTTWTTVHATAAGDGGVDDVAVAGTGRYLRVLGTQRATGWGYSLYEVEAYGGPPNVALNRPVTVSSTETADFPGRLAVDGNPATRWSSAYADPSWISVDLGTATPVRRVVLRWETAFARAYQIQLSPDGTAWTTVHTTAAGDGGVDDLAVTGTGRYLRVLGTQRATGWGYSLYELEAYP